MDKLTKEEKKLLEEIFEINKIIYPLYEKLCNLELKGEINSLEYKKILSYIKMVKEELEKEVYDKITKLHSNKKSQMVLSINPNKDNLDEMKNFLRISNSLLLQSKHNISFDYIIGLKNIISDFLNLEEESREKINNHISICREFYKTLDFEIDNLTLYFIEEEIKKENSDYKELVKLKYDFIFTKKELEDEILDNDLKSYNNFRIYSMIQIYNIDANIMKASIDKYTSDNLKKEIEEILLNNFSKNRLNYKKAYIRSLFTLMSEEELENQNYLFNQYIENKDYLINHPNNNEKEEFIKKLFKNINKDKKITKKLF